VVAARVAGFEPRVINLAGQSAIGDLPALLARCGVFIGNDSGAMHVAAAVGLPVVAVFGPTDPGGTAPLTPQLAIVRERVACSPCFLRHCPIDHRCMTGISVDAVFDVARPALRNPPALRGGRESTGA
jgi:heptosyltransferase-2